MCIVILSVDGRSGFGLGKTEQRRYETDPPQFSYVTRPEPPSSLDSSQLEWTPTTPYGRDVKLAGGSDAKVYLTNTLGMVQCISGDDTTVNLRQFDMTRLEWLDSETVRARLTCEVNGFTHTDAIFTYDQGMLAFRELNQTD